MAKTSKGWDKQVVIGEVKKTESTIVRVQYVEGEFDDKVYKGLDIREFYKKKGETEFNPSGKGLVVSIDKLDDFSEVFNKAVAEVKALAEKKPKKKPSTRKKVGAK